MATTPSFGDRYEPGERIGGGGMGECFRALDRRLNRSVAIKRLHAHLDDAEFRARFAREARAAAGLQHPSIVTIFDDGEQDGVPFIVMEFIEGQTLAELIAESPVPVPLALRLLEELCGGLAYAHRAGIIHRDIKPQNLLVERQHGTLKIVDFGIARLTGASATTTFGVLGTPRYMAPEQIEPGGRLDYRCDIFAAGAVAYELLTGQPAFNGDTATAVMRDVQHREPRSMRNFLPGAAAPVEEIVRRALQKRPADRYQDADGMRLALRQARDRLSGGRDSGAFDTPVRLVSPAPRRAADGTGEMGPIARLRMAQIASFLATARQQLSAGEYDEAWASCENAAAYDETFPETVALMAEIAAARRRRDALALVTEGQVALDRNDPDAAEALLERARGLDAEATPVRELAEAVLATRAALEELGRRAKEHASLVAAARHALQRGRSDDALKLAQEALELVPESTEGLALHAEASARMEEQRREAAADREALALAGLARRQFDEGHADAAIARLRQAPVHPATTEALAELTLEYEARQRQNAPADGPLGATVVSPGTAASRGPAPTVVMDRSAASATAGAPTVVVMRPTGDAAPEPAPATSGPQAPSGTAWARYVGFAAIVLAAIAAGAVIEHQRVAPAYEAELEERRTELASIREQLQTAQARIETADDALATARNAGEKVASTLESATSRLRADLAAMTAQRDDSRSKLELANRSLGELRDRHDKIQQTAAATQKRLDTLLAGAKPAASAPAGAPPLWATASITAPQRTCLDAGSNALVAIGIQPRALQGAGLNAPQARYGETTGATIVFVCALNEGTLFVAGSDLARINRLRDDANGAFARQRSNSRGLKLK